MQNSINRRIDKIEEQMNTGETETPLQAIARRQNCLIFFYSSHNAAPDDMVAYAKETGKTNEQVRNNLQIFQKLIEEKAFGGRKTIEHPMYYERRTV